MTPSTVTATLPHLRGLKLTVMRWWRSPEGICVMCHTPRNPYSGWVILHSHLGEWTA